MGKQFRIIYKVQIRSVFTFKSKNVAQSQLSFALSHDGETVTFRNSELSIRTKNGLNITHGGFASMVDGMTDDGWTVQSREGLVTNRAIHSSCIYKLFLCTK